MRCKPGDLAIVVRRPPFAPNMFGRICTVLYAAPVGAPHTLPNGVLNAPSMPDSWVIEAQHEFELLLLPRSILRTRFGVCLDSALRPIRPDEQPDQIVRELEAA